MIKIYTLTDYLTEQYRQRVFPLFLEMIFRKSPEVFNNFKIVDTMQEADIAIFPLEVLYFLKNEDSTLFYSFVTNATAHNVMLWIYTGGDFGKTFSGNISTFRLGGFKSKLNPLSQIMPAFIMDPYLEILKGEWKAISKTNLPTIGFVGQANDKLTKVVKDYIIFIKNNFYRIIGKELSDVQTFFPSSKVRYNVLNVIRNNPFIQSDFVFRSKYRAGARREIDVKETTLEFHENIERNLYTVCIRGAGNFSVRFYETLILGRIPILIDTDAQLPLSNIIKWEDHIIIATNKNVVQTVLDFHNSKSNDELLAIQKSNRKLALEKLNRLSYFIHVGNYYF